jgi:transposase
LGPPQLGCRELDNCRPRNTAVHLAVRILARAWLYVVWECWHHGVACHPARHRGLQRVPAAEATGASQAA